MRKALISVYDKTGVLDLARTLHGWGWQIIASGGTAKLLREAGLTVTEVADYTGSPEILGGRVKTLHPAIHGGILARETDSDRADLHRLNLDFIELVVVNLYPFEATIAQPHVTLAEAIEQIDIGGVALLRAAAKNHDRVAVLADPTDYGRILAEIREHGVTQPTTRRQLAVKAFATTATYDTSITGYLGGLHSATPPLQITAYPVQTLRYGENPHQAATLFTLDPGRGPLGGTVLQGKELSYNNLLDLDAAWRAALSFDTPAVCIVKHLSPSGVATAPTLAAAYRAAFACDPRSAFGGVIATNRPFDEEAAHALADLFVECIAAPDFTLEARAVLAKKKNCRLVRIPDTTLFPSYELRSINYGLLQQTVDTGDPAIAEWRVASTRQPTADEWRALKFAWQACQHVKSNAIVLARAEGDLLTTVGIGGGQPNRVDCVRLATERAGEQARGAVLASDAFFPFPDSVQLAAQAGVTAVVHPGGSVRDAESLAVAEAANMTLVLTGVRHFRH